MFYVFGLGNPGKEYEKNRHNTGAMAVAHFALKIENSKLKILNSKEFMNHSGKAVSKIKPKDLIVVYDDLDLPLGTIKISYGKSSGGHNGLESIIKSLKTKDFTRVRIGISPKKKPVGEKKVIDFLLSDFSLKETPILKKTFKKVTEALQVLIEEGRDRAMNTYN